MKAFEFVELVKRMRKAQKFYYSLNPKIDLVRKTEALVAAKMLESQVDKANIDDLHNLVTESPIA